MNHKAKITIFHKITLVTIVVLFYLNKIFCDQEPATSTESAHVQNETLTNQTDASQNLKAIQKIQKAIYKRLLKHKRKDQMEAVKNLRKMDKYENQYKMVSILSEKIFEVIESKKSVIADLTLDDILNFPAAELSNETHAMDIKDAISSILENIAFFGDISLSLPDITRRIIKREPKWLATMHWSFAFFSKTSELVDDSTLQMMNLALQELNVIEKRADFMNPYFPKKSPDSTDKKKIKKDKKQKGPILTKTEL